MSKHANNRDTFANRQEGRQRRNARRQARTAKLAFAFMGAA